MPQTIIQETITYALYEGEYREYLELEAPTPDRVNALLERLFGDAAQEADDWIDNPFDGTLDSNGQELTGLTIGSVKQGMYVWSHWMIFGQGKDAPMTPGVVSKKTDFLNEGYAGSKVTKPDDMLASLVAAMPHWAKFQRRWGVI